jgi:hypothetical protein
LDAKERKPADKYRDNRSKDKLVRANFTFEPSEPSLHIG